MASTALTMKILYVQHVARSGPSDPEHSALLSLFARVTIRAGLGPKSVKTAELGNKFRSTTTQSCIHEVDLAVFGVYLELVSTRKEAQEGCPFCNYMVRYCGGCTKSVCSKSVQ